MGKRRLIAALHEDVDRAESQRDEANKRFLNAQHKIRALARENEILHRNLAERGAGSGSHNLEVSDNGNMLIISQDGKPVVEVHINTVCHARIL